MKNLNVKTGDTVLVISGKDAGKQGKVLSTSPKTGRITVAGVNMISRHQKARKAQEKSSIVKKEGTIDVSNVMVICPTCGKPTRIKHVTNEDGKNVRACKCGAAIDKKFVKETKKAAKKATTEETKASSSEKAKATKSTTTKKAADKKVVATASAKDTKQTAVRKSAQRGV